MTERLFKIRIIPKTAQPTQSYQLPCICICTGLYFHAGMMICWGSFFIRSLQSSTVDAHSPLEHKM